MLNLFIFGSNILIWSGIPFITKNLLKDISPLNLTILRWVTGGFLGLILIFLFKNNLSLSSYNKKFYFILVGLAIFSFLASYSHHYLLKKYNADVVSIIVNPLIIFLSAILGNCLYDEPYTAQMWVGAFIIIIGLIVFTKGKNLI